jgi:hypothetical protein
VRLDTPDDNDACSKLDADADRLPGGNDQRITAGNSTPKNPAAWVPWRATSSATIPP